MSGCLSQFGGQCLKQMVLRLIVITKNLRIMNLGWYITALTKQTCALLSSTLWSNLFSRVKTYLLWVPSMDLFSSIFSLLRIYLNPTSLIHRWTVEFLQPSPLLPLSFLLPHFLSIPTSLPFPLSLPWTGVSVGPKVYKGSWDSCYVHSVRCIHIVWWHTGHIYTSQPFK